MEPETRLLRYFLAVAEELNFTRAASRLHIAQPSLSVQIRQLESQLGVTLLRRSTREVSLTEAGQALLDEGPVALAGVGRAWEAARLAGRGETGSLRLAYTLSAGHDTVPQLLQALHDATPRITVTTDLLPTAQVLVAVRDGRCDVGIARAPAPMDGIRLLPLRHDPLGVLVAADHPLGSRPVAEFADVVDHPVVLHPRAANPDHYDFITGLFTARGLRPAIVERDIAFDLSQGLITNGTAGTLVGRSTIGGLPDTMHWIPLAGPVTVTVSLVLASTRRSATAERFQRTARAHARARGWLARADREPQ